MWWRSITCKFVADSKPVSRALDSGHAKQCGTSCGTDHYIYRDGRLDLHCTLSISHFSAAPLDTEHSIMDLSCSAVSQLQLHLRACQRRYLIIAPLQFHTVEGLCQYTASAFAASLAHGEKFSEGKNKRLAARILNSEVKFSDKWLHKIKAFVLLCKLYVKC